MNAKEASEQKRIIARGIAHACLATGTPEAEVDDFVEALRRIPLVFLRELRDGLERGPRPRIREAVDEIAADNVGDGDGQPAPGFACNDDERRLIGTGMKIKAIQAVRARHEAEHKKRLGLKEAKELVDRTPALQ